jgi:hypothetical protein
MPRALFVVCCKWPRGKQDSQRVTPLRGQVRCVDTAQPGRLPLSVRCPRRMCRRKYLQPTSEADLLMIWHHVQATIKIGMFVGPCALIGAINLL